MFAVLINELLFRPILNILFILVVLFGGNMWWAIVVLTLLIRWLLYKIADPMAIQQQMWEWQADMQKKMKEIQDKYADDPTRQSQEMMNLMKTWWLSGPLKWCKTILFQFPVFIWLYGVISNFATYWDPNTGHSWMNFDIPYSEQVYSFLHNLIDRFIDLQHFDLTHLDTMFMGVDLLSKWNRILALIVGILMMANMKLMTWIRPVKMPDMWWIAGWAKMPDMSKMMWSMNYFMAIMMMWLVYNIASWVGIYMLTTTVFGIIQFIITNRIILKAKINAIVNKNKWVIVEKKW